MKRNLLLAALFSAIQGTALSAATVAVYAPIKLSVEHRETKLRGAIWYPTIAGEKLTLIGDNPVFYGTRVARRGEVTDGKHPVVLLSHGLGGNVRALSWLSAGLAKRGAVVVSVNHPDSTTRDFDLEKGLNHGTRAQDFSAVLDWLETGWGDRLDMSRVMAAGFSLGGFTALSLGGVTGDLAGYAAHCDEAGTRSSHCTDIARGGLSLASLDEDLWNRSYADDRVTHVATIDPGLLFGLSDASIEGLEAKVLLIGLGEGEDRLYATDFSEQGNGFAKLVTDADIVEIAPAYHFSTLLTCKPDGPRILAAEEDDPVCTDPEGADRAEIHARIIDAMAAHVGL